MRIEGKVQDLNEFVDFHNYIIYQVHQPENDYNILRKNIFESLDKILRIKQKEEIAEKFLRTRKSISSLLIDVNDKLDQLIVLNNQFNKSSDIGQANSSKYNAVQTKLESFQKSLSDFDGIKMIGQINFMINMISEENFSVSYETHSITENADYIRYRAEFKPNVLANAIPQGVAPANLEISFKVRGGWKYDVSSGFVLDIGLKDPSYYFDKTSDPSGKTVTLRQNGDGGNVTPSLAAFLNGYKRTSSNVKIGGAFGLGLSNNARFRLYLGPSIILGRKERIVISSGVSFGAISRLSNGYFVSQVLNNDSTLPTEVPTVLDKFQFGGYFGIGFNLTGKSNQSFLQNLKFK